MVETYNFLNGNLEGVVLGEKIYRALLPRKAKKAFQMQYCPIISPVYNSDSSKPDKVDFFIFSNLQGTSTSLPHLFCSWRSWIRRCILIRRNL